MPDFHIFNPETDYALGCGKRIYTAPGPVVELRRRMALLPAQYARRGDVVVRLDPPLPDPAREALAREHGVAVISLGELAGEIERAGVGNSRIRPWGWNAALRHLLLTADVPEELLPTEKWIERLRELAHRRTTIEFLKRYYSEEMPALELPVELHTEEDALRYHERHADCWLKAPWSSSGRGILPTAGLDAQQVGAWARGVIRRQGSLMGEVNMARTLDFATEWEATADDVRFVGYSCFEVSPRGRYLGNVDEPQARLERRISDRIAGNILEVVERQKLVLRQMVVGSYAGPLGIDMAALAGGDVNPCVEINFRNTMGGIRLGRCDVVTL